MKLLLPPRNSLAYPAGTSYGFDPSHPAARYAQPNVSIVSFIAQPQAGTFYNVLNGTTPTLEAPGTDATAQIRGTIGPSVVSTSAVSSYFTAPIGGTFTPTQETFAAIVDFTALPNNSAVGCLMTDANATGTECWLGFDTSAQFCLFPHGAAIGSGVIAAVGHAYFIAASVYTGLPVDFVIVDLTTGAIKTATVANTAILGQLNGTVAILADVGQPSETNVNIAAMMINMNAKLGLAEMLAWADDPWSFWYPRRLIGPDPWLALGKSGLRSLTMSADPGSFALAGETTPLKYQRQAMPAATGSFALTGEANSLIHGYKIAAAQGTLSLTGETNTLRATRKVTAAMGALSLTGEANTLRAARKLSLTQGAFSFTGEPISLLKKSSLTAADGVFALTGEPITLKATRLLSLANGLFVLTGEDATLTKPSARILAAASGVFAVTGQTNALLKTSLIDAGSGGFRLVSPFPPTHVYHFDVDFSDAYNSINFTPSGTAAISTAQSEFGGASAAFDGSANCCAFAGPARDFHFGTRSYTIDYWVRPSALVNCTHFDTNDFGDGNVNALCVQCNTNGKLFVIDNFNGNLVVSANGAIAVNAWQHIAITRDESYVTRLFIGGTLIGTSAAFPTSYRSENPFLIAADGTVGHLAGFFHGWIDEFRIVMGEALWTSNFTPPTSPYVVSLVPMRKASLIGAGSGGFALNTPLPIEVYHFDSNLNDAYGKHNFTAQGDAAISAVQSEFGGASLKLNGSLANPTSYASGDGSSDYAFGTNDFTVDFWAFLPSPITDATLITWIGDINNIELYVHGPSASLQFWAGNNNRLASASNSFTTNAWHHVALVRLSGSTMMFLDGVRCLSGVAGGSYADTNNYTINAGFPQIGLGFYFNNGYIDELRIIKGAAAWIHQFTPPTAPYSGLAPSEPGAALRKSTILNLVAGAFTLTGEDATLTAVSARTMPAGTGVFALVGVANTLKAARLLALADGLFNLTGEVATLRPARRMPAADGLFSLTGEANTLRKTSKLSANDGVFSLTGEANSLRVGRKIAAANALFSLTGEANTLRKTSILTAANGAFVLTGETANLTAPIKFMPAGTGAFTLTGEAVNLLAGRKLVAANGLYTLTGEANTLRATRLLALGDGVFSLTGEAATLTRTAANKMFPDAAYFLLSGEANTLLAKRKLSLADGVFSISGEASSLLHGYRLAGANALFNLLGEASTLRATRRLALAQGNFTLTGETATLVRAARITAASGLFSLLGESVTLTLFQGITAVSGTFALTGQPATLLARRLMRLETGEFVLTGEAGTMQLITAGPIVRVPSLTGADYAPGLQGSEDQSTLFGEDFDPSLLGEPNP